MLRYRLRSVSAHARGGRGLAQRTALPVFAGIGCVRDTFPYLTSPCWVGFRQGSFVGTFFPLSHAVWRDSRDPVLIGNEDSAFISTEADVCLWGVLESHRRARTYR